MPTEAIAAVLLAAMLHAGWNAAAKSASQGDSLVATLAIVAGGAAAAVPILALTGLPSAASLPYLLASGVIHVGYFVLVGLGYRHADYSVAYPVTRGSAPLVTASVGTLVLGEALPVLAWLGICLLATGVLGLGADALRRGGFTLRSIAIAALTVAVIVTYTLVDGIGVRHSGNAGGYVVGLMLATGILLVPLLPWLGGTATVRDMVVRWPVGLAGGLMVTLSYGIALWAMTKAPIGVVAALRETSVLFATILAAVVLKERFGPIRWGCAVAIVSGLITLRLA